jgi:hypothetical protein
MYFPQIINYTHNSSNYAALSQDTPICQLPVELFFEILKHLEPITVNTVCFLTCKQFEIISSSSVYGRFWQNLFCFHFPNEKTNGIDNFNLAYKNKNIILSNVNNGIYVTSILQRQEPVFHLTTDDKGRLVARIGDDLVEILDPISFKCVNTLSPSKQHGFITSLAASNGKLYVGFLSGTIEILDMATGLSINTLNSHTHPISSLTIIGEDLIAVYRDHTIEILNIKAIEIPDIEYQKTVLKEQNCGDFFLTASLITPDGKYVAAKTSGFRNASFSACITIKDLASQKELATLPFYGNAFIISLSCADERLYARFSDREIKVFDIKSLLCLHTLIPSPETSTHEQSLIMHPHSQSLLMHQFSPGISITFANEHLYVANENDLIALDFTKNPNIVLGEIAGQLKKPGQSQTMIENAMQKFSRMPPSQKNRIYQKLYLLCNPSNHYWGWGEDAFHDRNNQFSSPEEKGIAIENELASIEKANASFRYYPLLQCLNIETVKDYSEQLGCRPWQLKERGIITLKDLNVICPLSLEIQELAIDLSPTNSVNLDFREQQVIANRNRLDLSNLCNQILNAVTAMDLEAKNCGKILYEGDEHWNELKEQLNTFNTLLRAIEEKCDKRPHAIIQAFTGDEYAVLAKQLNNLIREFHEVDCRHRITKLRAYIHQEVILQVWTSPELIDQGVLSLNDFQEKYHCALRELLHMKEFIEKH